MRGTTIFRSLVLVIGVTLAVAGCTGAGASRESPTAQDTAAPTAPVSAPPRPMPELPRLHVGPASWTTAGLGEVWRVVLAGDAIAYGRDNGRTVVVTDLASGGERWRIEEKTPLNADGASVIDGPLAASADGEVLLAEYFLTRCPTSLCAPGEVSVSDERGLVALSADDGSVLWTTPLRPSVAVDDPAAGYYSSLWLERIAVDDSTVVVTLTNKNGAPPPAGRATTESQGLDLATGEVRWRTPGLALPELPGAAAWVEHVDPDEQMVPGSAVGVSRIDARTGTSLWRAEDLAVAESALGGAYLAGAAGGKIVTSLGDELEPPEGFGSCGGGALLVCQGFRSGNERETRLLTVDADGDVTDSGWFPDIGGVPESAPAGYVWLEGDDDASVAVDVHGNVLSTPVAGHVVSMSARHLLVRTGRDADLVQQYAVHPLD